MVVWLGVGLGVGGWVLSVGFGGSIGGCWGVGVLGCWNQFFGFGFRVFVFF